MKILTADDAAELARRATPTQDPARTGGRRTPKIPGVRRGKKRTCGIVGMHMWSDAENLADLAMFAEISRGGRR